MNKDHKTSILVSLMLVACVMSSCKYHEDEYHTITDKINAESKNYHGVTTSSADHIGYIETIEITVDEHSFLIPERKGLINSYACTECHSKPLDQMQDSNNGKKAHWDIKLNHADLNTMNCVTCHNGSDMDNLASLTGNTIDFNASYQLCSQCHDKQFEDWKGGAHGKRIGGWAPPRASMTCVNCHDPHDPGFQSKWPARFNTQKIEERE